MAVFGAWQVKPWPLLFPLALSISAFVLSMIALFAGTGPQQQALEQYHVVSLNMSYFGHELIPTPTQSEEPAATETGGSLLDQLTDQLEDIGDDIQDAIIDQLNDAIGNVADELAEDLGISQWYSLHLMNYCQGDFAPNATTVGAWYNTTNCTARAAGVSFNLTELLNREISAGPLNLNLADIPLPDAIEDAVDSLNQALFAIFVLYVLGSALSGFSILLTIITMVASVRWVKDYREDGHAKTILANSAFSFLAVVALAAASITTTVAAKKCEKQINDSGEDIGISASAGMKFIAITWAAFATMFVAHAFWSALCCFPRNRFTKTSKSSI